jgi:hypothetical protein
MIDLSIDRLNVQIIGAAGHEHRVHAISQRAAVLLAQRLDELRLDTPASETAIPAVAAAPVPLDLARKDDETCAFLLADSMLNAVRFQVRG